MEKLERLDAYLEANDLASVWFARPNSYAWLTGGSSVIDREADAGVAAVGYDGDQRRVLTDTIEAERTMAEEVPDLPEDTPVETFPWYEDSLAGALADLVEGPAAADIDVPGFESVDPMALRQPLTETDRQRYRELGRATATAVESVCRELRPEDTEHEVASALRIALSARQIEAPVVLVGSAARAQQYRHYTPKEAELGDYVLLSVTAQRHGLHASCTRTVAFDPPEWLEDRHTTAARVETEAIATTQAQAQTDAGTAGDVFAAIQNAYASLGYEGEWELHHQGGAAGFAGREWIATPDHEAPVTAPMAYAWNPTVQGAKSEDTVLITEDEIEVLTTTGHWPTRTVRAVDHDLELERPGILGIHDDDGDDGRTD
ncbi:M24 family metallopeptidase [Halobacteria archaeon AArc-m2/3/4]|uniref:M24 family metallopeptidase n=1 Tax=Natronoglomus mannanivorans TaxID=2979990 RepID=A0ABT2Q907_9EURY|nr:M24 family metallopeptidase [Halobacteria archaeon AArc-m2/3/4]